MKVVLNIRKTLEGNILIKDHPMFHIVIVPSNRKILSFPRQEFGDEAYYAQMRMFDFLEQKGAVVLGSTQGGNIHNSIEAQIPEKEGYDAYQVLVLSVYKFVLHEKESYYSVDDYNQDMAQAYLNPSDEESTELGEVPHAVRKGSIPDRPYGKYGGYYGYFY